MSEDAPKIQNKELKEWLRANNKDREDLAKELGVSKGTLDNWFSRGFPEWAVLAIKRIMNPSDDLSAGLEVSFTASEFREILDAMEIVGTSSLKTFYEEAIKSYVEKIFTQEAEGKTKRGAPIAHFPAQQPSSLVAEDSSPSNSSHGHRRKNPPSKTGTED